MIVIEDTPEVTQESKSLKTRLQREEDQRKAGLPILQIKEQFCERLKREKVLIVTAEIGSGKTTQLPQYCADIFEGKVICTQPRKMAALSLAKRIAEENDGSSIGKSVGYRVAGRVELGSKIELMTEESLITLLEKNPKFDGISVLMIDEAHERSLSTDIALGIAKIMLAMTFML